MPKIIQLSPHIANLIAAGEVVERPASVVKELLENAVDAGASKVTVEIRSGGMTYLRVTDNGCGMGREDARTAFLRHTTSKLRTAEDLAAIGTLGFRGEALAAIASVSRIDLMTKTAGALSGISLQLEAGAITEEEEIGCPEGTTIVVRDLFYNTPARMKFMKSDAVEGGKVAAAVQLQALAHPEVSFTFLRDGKQTLQTPGSGELGAAVYCVYGRESARFAEVQSRWEGMGLRGFVSKPTDARPSRSLQTFFVNNRPVKSKLLTQALEEAYRNQLMAGKFPACVLHLTLPPNAVDVNVHPAKTEVKFLSEKAVFDCVHYGVLAALNKTPDRPVVQLKTPPAPAGKPKQDFFRTMTPQEFQSFSSAMAEAPKVAPKAARPVIQVMNTERPAAAPVREPALPPIYTPSVPPPIVPKVPVVSKKTPLPEPEQTALPMPKEVPWRFVGELYRSYLLVEQGDEAFLIDKHAAHERILFEKLRAGDRHIDSQALLSPVPVRLRADGAAQLLAKAALLESLGFELEEFGENTVLVRRIPMDLGEGQIADALLEMADDLLSGRGADLDAVRDELLHTMACKAAIKAGWVSDERELLALIKEVMGREELKYCPHGRPICVTLSKKMLEREFKR